MASMLEGKFRQREIQSVMLGSYLFYTHLASHGRNRFKRNLETCLVG